VQPQVCHGLRNARTGDGEQPSGTLVATQSIKSDIPRNGGEVKRHAFEKQFAPFASFAATRSFPPPLLTLCERGSRCAASPQSQKTMPVATDGGAGFQKITTCGHDISSMLFFYGVVEPRDGTRAVPHH
jgi:hypothetical protein